MKKALLLVSLLGSMVALADADSYLYWMITSSDSYNYAMIRSDTASDAYLTIYNAGLTELKPDSTMATYEQVSDAADYGVGLYAAVDSSSLPSSFIVELYNAEGNFISQSVLNGPFQDYLYGGGMGMPPSAFAEASSFAIPEPSSGLLMLVGCAVLGLRRRKQKNA